MQTRGAGSVATAPEAEAAPRTLAAVRGRVAALVLLSGGALALAFPEADLAPLAWIALVPLLLACGWARPGTAFLLGTLFGIGFFGALLAWISLVGWLAWGLLVALQAATIGLFALAWSLAARASSMTVRVLAPPLLWVAVEYLRGMVPLGGFTWGQLAQSQTDLSWLMTLAALGGGWLVAFVVVLMNAAIAEGVRVWRGGERRVPAALGGLALLALGGPALLPEPVAAGTPVRVAIVQGNVPKSFPGSSFDRELAIIRSHERLTTELAGSGVDLVVWPESSLGLDLGRVPEARAAVARAARAVGAPLLVGGNLDAGEDRYLVMAFHIAPDGSIVDRYQKTHLVPFGEYVPGRAALEWLPILDQVPRDAIAGGDPVVFDVAGGAVAPVISFEGDFGSLVRRRIAAGGRMLVVATNTSTWGRSWASAQHVAFSRLRAAENGVWVVHAAISGISAFVRPDGEVVADTPLWDATTLVHGVRFAEEVTLYARAGDWVPVLCAAGSLAVVGVAAVRRRRWVERAA